jgi:hypothetical protein
MDSCLSYPRQKSLLNIKRIKISISHSTILNKLLIFSFLEESMPEDGVFKKFLRYIDNGIFQRIFYLGAAGWMIINRIDKEIVLIDPWPSFSKNQKRKKGKDRIQKLVLWLREKIAQQYRITGILAGHEHYDHIGDIPLILSMLIDKSIQGAPAATPDQLPCIYCDSSSREKLEESKSPYMKFCEIMDGDMKLFYDDMKVKELVKKNVPGYPLTAGKAVNTMQIGKFEVTPYIWDHSNTVLIKKNGSPTALSGSHQRTSAFLIKRTNDENMTEEPRKTFIAGSGGEMHRDYTSDVCDTRIDSDLLLQAVAAKAITNLRFYKDHLSRMVNYQVRNIHTERIVSSHFEDFIGPRITGPGELEKRIHLVVDYYNELKNQLTAGQKLPEVNIMERLCFEYDPHEIAI